MRLIFSWTMILTTAFAAGCGAEVSTGGSGGGGTGGKEATSSTASSTGSGGQGGDVTSSTTSGTGGAIGKWCGDCVEASDPFATGTSCGDSQAACQKDVACKAWLGCTNDCVENDWSTACFSACDTASAGSKSLYEPLYACVCAACADPCGLVCK